MREIGNDMILASKEMKSKNWIFHAKAFLGTFFAWTFRFFILGCMIIAFTPISLDFMTQFGLYARLEAMFVILAFSPTPGGAGIVEVLFGGFLSDYVSDKTSALVIAFSWRLITYYSYLLAGALIIPNWIRKIINNRKRKRFETK